MAARRFIIITLAMLTPFLLALGCEPVPNDVIIVTPTFEASTPSATPTRFPTRTPAPQPTADNSHCAPIGSTGRLRPSPHYTSQSSVSGIPLDEAACYGGILKVAYTEEGPSFNTWEETGGVAFKAMHPLHNMLVRPRTWGDVDDYHNHVFFELRHDLAAAWDLSADGTTWTFRTARPHDVVRRCAPHLQGRQMVV